MLCGELMATVGGRHIFTWMKLKMLFILKDNIYDTEKRLVEIKFSDIHEHLNVEYKKKILNLDVMGQ